jgi:radical SAM protein with 4Fe4S-binding SPASM domain
MLKIVSGYLLSRLTGRVFFRGKPVTLSIEPTNNCNLRCPECPSGMNILTRKRGSMDLERFKKIISQLSPELFHLTLYFQGEPYLNPLFFEMVKFAHIHNIRVDTSTNGHYLDAKNVASTLASGLDRLIISLDGTDAGAYQQYRIGGSFEKVIRGISEVVRQKKENRSAKPTVELQFLVLASNQHQMKEIKKLGRELGVDRVTLKTAQFYNTENGNPLMPDPGKYSRYKKNNAGRWMLKNRLPDHCFRMWRGCVITWDGQVVPCCFDKDALMVMGSVDETPFAEIWTNKDYDHFRKTILYKRKSVEMCRNCTEGM